MTKDEDAVQRLFARIRSFGWHEEKRQSNLAKHGIDFVDVTGVFDGPTFIRRSDRHGQIRYQVLGIVEGREVAVACTVEDERCRIISARRARWDERRDYHRRLAGRTSEGQD
jgi:uncharacterized DUF497 family protein